LQEGLAALREVVECGFEAMEHLEDEQLQARTSGGFKTAYDTVFKLCTNKNGDNSDKLYEFHTAVLSDYYRKYSVEKLKPETSSEVFLKEWVTRWNIAKKVVSGMARYFGYLDRFYVKNSPERLGMFSQGFELYRTIVFEPFKGRARHHILGLIQEEREGQLTRDIVRARRSLLRGAIDVFLELGAKLTGDKDNNTYCKDDGKKIYRESFQECGLIKQTEVFYEQRSQQWMDENTGMSCPDYLRKAEGCIKAELKRLKKYLDPACSTDPLMKAVQDELLRKPQTKLLNKESGLKRMLVRAYDPAPAASDSAREDLARLYRLYNALPTVAAPKPEDEKNYEEATRIKNSSPLKPIADRVRNHILGVAKDYVTKSQDKTKGPEKPEKDLIPNLIDLHQRFVTIVTEDFGSNTLFKQALRDAFASTKPQALGIMNVDFREFAKNKSEFHMSNLLARFCHDILRKNGITTTDVGLDKTMDRARDLYAYLSSKDVFEMDYQQYLADRLLGQRVLSDEGEKSMIAKLRQESGYAWSAKLEQMFNDIALSRQLHVEFRQKMSDEGKNYPVELDPTVIQHGQWPNQKITKATPPGFLVVEEFKKFYLSKYNGKKLDVRMDHGHADVDVVFRKGYKRSLTVSTYQMMVLLLFKGNTPVTFEEMLERTGIERDELVRHVVSLCAPGQKILRRKAITHPPKECFNTDVFGINPKFTPKLYKTKVQLLPRVKTTVQIEEQQRAHQKLRKHQMQAAIVRVMKARKEMKHQDLMQEVTRQLSVRFTAVQKHLKREIQTLIEGGEYMKRKDGERSTYEYVA